MLFVDWQMSEYRRLINMVSVHRDSSFSLLVSDPANQIFEMECHQMKSVISLVDSLVRSAQVRRSRIRNTSQTDFSICSILGLESEVTQSSSISGKINVTWTVYAVIASGFFHWQLNINFTLLIESPFFGCSRHACYYWQFTVFAYTNLNQSNYKFSATTPNT